MKDEEFKHKILAFLDSFELVFGDDWNFTKNNLSDDCNESYIRKNGTFLSPDIGDEFNNWYNRGRLLANYRELCHYLVISGIRNAGNDKMDFCRAFFGASEDGKMAFFEHLLKGKNYKRVREFIVTESPEGFDERTMIVHIPSGMWKGSDLVFEKILARLEENVDGDKKLIASLFEV